MNVYGDPHKIEFFGFFVGAIQSLVPSFEGPPMDPLPLPFQLQDPERLRQEFAKAGLKAISVETITEKTEFQSGEHLWDWLVHSNPIVGMVLGELNLTKEQTAMIAGAGGHDPRALRGKRPRRSNQPHQHRHRNEVNT
jgi:hypothetical protein